MSPVDNHSSDFIVSGRSPIIPGFDISWVGECPWNRGLCFGSEDGRILITSYDGRFTSKALQSRPVRSGEPVNGVAFLNNGSDRRMLAVSTRCDITLIETNGPEGKEKHRIEIDWGARGIYATTTGQFVAPLGPEGVFAAGPNFHEDPNWTIQPLPSDDPITIYGLAPLGGDGQQHIFGCAARGAGITALLVRPGGVQIARHFFFPDLDIVDVCGMTTLCHPHALVGLGADGSFNLFRDLFDYDDPLTLHPKSRGAAYSIRRAADHLILLTSEGVYVFPEFAQRFIDTDLSDHELIEFYGFAVEAVDFFVVYDRFYLVLHDRTIEIPLSKLIPGTKVAPPIRTPALDSQEIRSLDGTLDWSPQPFQIQMIRVA